MVHYIYSMCQDTQFVDFNVHSPLIQSSIQIIVNFDGFSLFEITIFLIHSNQCSFVLQLSGSEVGSIILIAMFIPSILCVLGQAWRIRHNLDGVGLFS